MHAGHPRTQVFLGLNDTDSAHEASRRRGEVDRQRATWTRGESIDDASWSWTDGRLMGKRGGTNEGLSRTLHREALFPPGVFTALRKDQAVVRAFEGTRLFSGAQHLAFGRQPHLSPSTAGANLTVRPTRTGDGASTPLRLTPAP